MIFSPRPVHHRFYRTIQQDFSPNEKKKKPINLNSLNKSISIGGFRRDELIYMSNQIHRTNLTFVDTIQ